jgi:hypothetical protein
LVCIFSRKSVVTNYLQHLRHPVNNIDPNGGDVFSSIVFSPKFIIGAAIGGFGMAIVSKNKSLKTIGFNTLLGMIVGGTISYGLDFSLSDGYRLVSSGINLTNMMSAKKNFYKLLNDLEDFTGLELSTVTTGNKQEILTYREKNVKVGFSFNKDKDNRKQFTLFSKRVKKGGSPTARKILGAAIKSQRSVIITTASGESTHSKGRDDMNLNPKDIEKEMTGAENLNKRTWGWGFAFLHEYLHTKPGGGFTDGPEEDQMNSPGPVETILNKIRRELGSEFGERMIYFRPGYGFIPFDEESYGDMLKGKIPTSNSKFLKIVY